MEVIGLLSFSLCPDVVELEPSAIGMLEKGNRLSVKKCVLTRTTDFVVYLLEVE